MGSAQNVYRNCAHTRSPWDLTCDIRHASRVRAHGNPPSCITRLESSPQHRWPSLPSIKNCKKYRISDINLSLWNLEFGRLKTNGLASLSGNGRKSFIAVIESLGAQLLTNWRPIVRSSLYYKVLSFLRLPFDSFYKLPRKNLVFGAENVPAYACAQRVVLCLTFCNGMPFFIGKFSSGKIR